MPRTLKSMPKLDHEKMREPKRIAVAGVLGSLILAVTMGVAAASRQLPPWALILPALTAVAACLFAFAARSTDGRHK